MLGSSWASPFYWVHYGYCSLASWDVLGRLPSPLRGIQRSGGFCWLYSLRTLTDGSSSSWFPPPDLDSLELPTRLCSIVKPGLSQTGTQSSSSLLLVTFVCDLVSGLLRLDWSRACTKFTWGR